MKEFENFVEIGIYNWCMADSLRFKCIEDEFTHFKEILERLFPYNTVTQADMDCGEVIAFQIGIVDDYASQMLELCSRFPNCTFIVKDIDQYEVSYCLWKDKRYTRASIPAVIPVDVIRSKCEELENGVNVTDLN